MLQFFLCALMAIASSSWTFGDLVNVPRAVETEDPIRRNVGQIWVVIPGETRSRELPLCTAFVLTQPRQTVLTAGHCLTQLLELFDLSDFSSQEAMKVMIEFGVGLELRMNRRSYPIEGFQIHPSFLDNRTRDIGRLFVPSLKDGLRKGQLTHLELASELPSQNELGEVRLYGFVMSTLRQKLGYLDTVLATQAALVDGDQWTLNEQYQEVLEQKKSYLYFLGTGRHSCVGSSGGPILLKTQQGWEVLSMIIKGPENCSEKEANSVDWSKVARASHFESSRHPLIFIESPVIRESDLSF